MCCHSHLSNKEAVKLRHSLKCTVVLKKTVAIQQAVAFSSGEQQTQVFRTMWNIPPFITTKVPRPSCMQICFGTLGPSASLQQLKCNFLIFLFIFLGGFLLIPMCFADVSPPALSLPTGHPGWLFMWYVKWKPTFSRWTLLYLCHLEFLSGLSKEQKSIQQLL